MRQFLILMAIAFLFAGLAAPMTAFAQDATATAETEEPADEPEQGEEGEEGEEGDEGDEEEMDEEEGEEEMEDEDGEEEEMVETLPATGGNDLMLLSILALGAMSLMLGGARLVGLRR